MKDVVNISLGRSDRNYQSVFEIAGQRVRITRRGFDGDVKAFVRHAKELQICDAVAIGGINASYCFEQRTWKLAQYKELASYFDVPVCEGLWVKRVYETQSLRNILLNNPDLASKRWLAFSVLDRYSTYAELKKQNICVNIGDAYAALGIPIFPKHQYFRLLADIFLPIFAAMPVKLFYPHTMSTKRCPSNSILKPYEVLLSETNFLLHKGFSNFENKTIILSRADTKIKKALLAKGAHQIFTLLPAEILSANIIEAMVKVTIGFNHNNDYIINQIDQLKRLE